MGLWRGGFPRPVIPSAQAEIDGNIQLLENLCHAGILLAALLQAKWVWVNAKMSVANQQTVRQTE